MKKKNDIATVNKTIGWREIPAGTDQADSCYCIQYLNTTGGNWVDSIGLRHAITPASLAKHGTQEQAAIVTFNEYVGNCAQSAYPSRTYRLVHRTDRTVAGGQTLALSEEQPHEPRDRSEPVSEKQGADYRVGKTRLGFA